MQFLRLFILILTVIFSTNAAILRTAMTNNYPQIAVLGCGSNKTNLYYDIQRQVWVEHLISSCVEDEQSILEFCQQAYPSLNIGNIIRLNTVLSFDNWCELIPSKDDSIPRCKTEGLTEETVQPYRCLHINSQREELTISSMDCTVNSIIRPTQCLRTEKWQQLASYDCTNKTMILNSSIIPLDWCGLGEFRGIKYICCVAKDTNTKNDYETNVDEQDDNALDEDDPIQELLIVPKTTTTIKTHRKIIAMSPGSREPNWMDDYRQWNSDKGYFADDEDTNDEQEEIKLSSSRKSHLTINEHERFTLDKQEFQRKYNQQINQLKSRWQQRQSEIQLIANENPSKAQNEYEKSELEFRQEYGTIKQTATRERTRINQLHESNLDSILDMAKSETYQKLNAVWNENPLKTENIKDALYNYLHVLLRDRIHLVNRYERLRVVDPDQAKRKQVSIHERLRLIANQINDALNKLRRYSKFQSKIQPYIDTLLTEYDEVNRAADKLLLDYMSSSSSSTITTTVQNQFVVPLGRDENVNNEYDYDKSNDNDDEYDDDDDDTDESTTTKTRINKDPIDIGISDWDVDTDATFNVNINSNNAEQINDNNRPLIPIRNQSTIQRYILLTYLPYIIGVLFILCLIFAFLIFRFLLRERRKSHYKNNYVFTQVDPTTPEDKALYALQMSGYENPTYKYFESQTPKC